MSAKQKFGFALSAEMKRVALKPKRLITASIFALAAVGLFMGVTAVTEWTVNYAASEGLEGASELGSMSAFLGFGMSLSLISFCFGIYASAFSARDFNDGAVLSSLLVVPNRARLFVARLLPWVFLSAVFSLAAFAVIAGIGISRAGADQATTIVLQGLLATVGSVFTAIVGFCCGTITKKGSLSVFLFLGLFFLLPTLVGMASGFGPDILQTIMKGVDAAMPGNAFGRLLGIVPLGDATVDTWIALGVSLAWAIGSPVLAYVLFKARGTLGR